MGAIAGYVVNEPAPIMVLLPTDDSCRSFVVSDLEPIFEASPVVAGVLSSEADETGRNTMRYRRFPGGSLKINAARSPRNLRAHTVRILLIDEEDAIEVTAEGDALVLAINRTLSFLPNARSSAARRRRTRTPRRSAGVRASDKRVYEMRCVECQEYAETEVVADRVGEGSGRAGSDLRHRTETAAWPARTAGW